MLRDPRRLRGKRRGGEPSYTVSFDTQGGSTVASATVEEGKQVARPADPTKSGMRFINWYPDATVSDTPYNFTSPVTQDLTLYARWASNYCSVQFDLNGGAPPLVPFKTAAWGESIAEPATPTRVGYEFDNWYTDAAMTKRAAFPHTAAGDVNFYARWIARGKTTVSFKRCVPDMPASGVDYTEKVFADVEVPFGGKIPQPENPEDIVLSDEEKLTFSYWDLKPFYQADVQTFPALFPLTVGTEPELSLYAVYTRIRTGETLASLTVHPCTGEANTKMFAVKGDTLGAKLSAYTPYALYSNGAKEPLRAGYEIGGYYHDAAYTPDRVYKVPFCLAEDSNDVYLKWNKATDLSVTYWMDTGNRTTNGNFAFNGTLTRPENPFRVGYTFDGWFTDYITSDEYRWDFDYKVSKTDVDLVAKWVKTACVVEFDTAGGTELTSMALPQGMSVEVLPEPYRGGDGAGYNFEGWYRDADFAQKLSFPFLADADLKLYAKWSAVSDLSMFRFDFNATSGGYDIALRDEYKKTVTKLTLPDRYLGVPVYRLSQDGLRKCPNLVEVTLPKLLQTVSYYALADNPSLKTIHAGDAIVQFSDHALDGCIALESVNAPASLRLVFAELFKNSPKMRASLRVDEYGFYHWGDILLGSAAAIEGKTTPDTVTKTLTTHARVIAGKAFANCKALEEVIADQVVFIAGRAFEGTPLKRLVLSYVLAKAYVEPNYVTFPASLETIELPSGNPYFDYKDGCLVERSTATLITSIKSATTIPAGVKIIGAYAFAGKTAETVSIPNTVTTLQAYAFKNCKFTAVDLPDSVGALDETAFNGCSETLDIRFGAKVPRVTRKLFASMKKLKTLTVSDQNEAMFSVDHVIYDKRSGELIYIPAAFVGELNLRDGITVLPEGLIVSGEITRVVIPDSVSVVERGAFSGALAKLASVYLGANCPATPGSFYLPWSLRSIELSPENKSMVLTDDGLLCDPAFTYLFYALTKDVLRLPETVENCYMIPLATKELYIGAAFDYYAFDDWFNPMWGSFFENLEWVEISENNPDFVSSHGVVYTKDPFDFYAIPERYAERTKELVIDCRIETITESLAKYVVSPQMFDTISFEAGSKLTAIDCGDGGYYESFFQDGSDPFFTMSVECKTLDLRNATELSHIGAYAFRDLTDGELGLIEVLLPNRSMTIGEGAFYSCTALKRVNVPAAANVGLMAFGNSGVFDENGMFVVDGRLIEINNGAASYRLDGVTSVAANAYYNVTGNSLVTFTIPAAVETVEPGAFVACYEATVMIYCEAEAPGVGWAEGWCFEECIVIWDALHNQTASDGKIYTVNQGLMYALDPTAHTAQLMLALEAPTGELEIPAAIDFKGVSYSVAAVGNQAFCGAGALTAVTIPDCVESIGEYAFGDCVNLARVTFAGDSALKSIGWRAFDNCEKLSSIVLPDCATALDGGIFYGCTALVSVTLPAGLTAIPASMFNGCAALETIELPAGIVTIGNSAFQGCKSIAGIALPAGVESIGDWAFQECAGLTELELPAGLVSIGSSAFKNCVALVEITVPDSVTLIKNGAFGGCAALARIALPFAGDGGKNTHFGYIFGASKYSDHAKYVPASLREVRVGGTAIADNAFNQCASIERITFGAQVAHIGKFALQDCVKLIKVDFEAGSVLKTIGDQAFYRDAALAELTLPGSVTTMGKFAFGSCLALAKVVYGGSIADWCVIKFANPTANPLNDGAVFYVGDDKVTELVIPEGVARINSYAFYQCPSIGSVSLPASLASVGAYALSAFSTTDASGVMYVGKWAVGFDDTISENVALRADTVGIADQAFYQASRLKSIRIPASVTSLGSYAFGETAITQITLPASITTVGEELFYGCAADCMVTVAFAEGALPGGWNAAWNYNENGKVIVVYAAAAA